MLRGKFKFNAVCHIFFIALSRQQNLQQNIAQCATDNQPQHSPASLELTLLCSVTHLYTHLPCHTGSLGACGP